MARLKGPIQFIGSIGNLRSYYDRRVKGYIVATKGGASKELILNNPAFARTRENMNEFKACGMWASLFRKALLSISHLHGGYYFSDIVSIAKRLQNRDTVNTKGYRSIESSKTPILLSLIKFNSNHPFERVCLCRMEVALSEDKKTVTLKIPELHPYSNIDWPTGYESFRFSLVALQLADMVWNEAEKEYEPTVRDLELLTATTISEWRSWNTTIQYFEMETSFAAPALQHPGTMVVVAVGVVVSVSPYDSSYDTSSANGTMGIVKCIVPRSATRALNSKFWMFILVHLKIVLGCSFTCRINRNYLIRI
jgi:hypothetical protein